VGFCDGSPESLDHWEVVGRVLCLTLLVDGWIGLLGVDHAGWRATELRRRFQPRVT
jgi:hypothetical protein